MKNSIAPYGIGLILAALVACGQVKKDNPGAKEKKSLSVNEEKAEDPLQIRADSMSIAFLSKAVYDSAIYYNNLPLEEKSYKLNEIRPFFIYSGLKKVFNEEQFTQPIPMREVTWEFNENDVVTVWYCKESGKWLPVDVYQYGKNTKF